MGDAQPAGRPPRQRAMRGRRLSVRQSGGDRAFDQGAQPRDARLCASPPAEQRHRHHVHAVDLRHRDGNRRHFNLNVGRFFFDFLEHFLSLILRKKLLSTYNMIQGHAKHSF